jgi:hypothetical protein
MPNPSDIAIMLGDEYLIRLVASWPKLTPEQRKDEIYISIVANIDSRYIESLITRAKAHEIIFEDGTVNEFATKYINMIVVDAINNLKKPKSK